MTRSLLVAALIVAAARSAAAATITEVHYVMGTYFQISAEDADETHARTALRRCFTTARALDERFSRFDPHSELSRINASDEVEVMVSAAMAALLERAQLLRDRTGGAFDIGTGALTALWRTATTWPNAAQVANARAPQARVSVRGRTLVRGDGARIDLDGIAKGWAVDECVEVLRSSGIRSALLSLGESSLYALGSPPGQAGWTVTVRGLDGEHALGVLTLRDEAVSVSAVFGHEHRIGSVRVGHIVDPGSGYPLRTPAMAVVVTASATDAEAFSKALLVQMARGTTSLKVARHLRVPSPYGTVDFLANSASTSSARAVGDSISKKNSAHPELVEGSASRLSTVSYQGAGQGEVGTLLIRPGGVQRSGQIRFMPFKVARQIAAAAEPLR